VSTDADPALGPELPGEAQPVLPRHPDVEDHEIDRSRRGRGRSQDGAHRLAAVGRADVQPVAQEILAQRVADLDLVVDDQNMRPGFHDAATLPGRHGRLRPPAVSAGPRLSQDRSGRTQKSARQRRKQLTHFSTQPEKEGKQDDARRARRERGEEM
jgi:hypothetical protein